MSWGQICILYVILLGDEVIKSFVIVYDPQWASRFKIAINNMFIRESVYPEINQQPFFNIEFVKSPRWLFQCLFYPGRPQVFMKINDIIEADGSQSIEHFIQIIFQGMNTVNIRVGPDHREEFFFGQVMDLRIGQLLF